MAKPLQLDGAVQWLRESAARAKERRKVGGADSSPCHARVSVRQLSTPPSLPCLTSFFVPKEHLMASSGACAWGSKCQAHLGSQITQHLHITTKTIVIPQCSHTLPSTNIHVPCFSTRLPFTVQTSLCGPAHMWLLNQFDREVQAATCIQRAWRAYHQRVAGMSDEERKKMELRWVRCGKALTAGASV